MDNPTCPKCGHNNAMLGVSETLRPDGTWLVLRACRDCGYSARGAE